MHFCTEVNEKHCYGTSGVTLLSPCLIVFCYSLTSPFGLEEIGSTNSGVAEGSNLLGCYIVLLAKESSTFRNIVVSSFSGVKQA